MDARSLYESAKDSRKRVLKEDFYIRFRKEIDDAMKDIVGKCETNQDDIRYWQGQARAFRRVLGMPDNIIKKLYENLKE